MGFYLNMFTPQKIFLVANFTCKPMGLYVGKYGKITELEIQAHSTKLGQIHHGKYRYMEQSIPG